MIAKTILKQLGGNKFLAMTGAKNLMDHKNGLSFRIPGTMSKNKINYVKIVLNSLDTYDLEFGRIFKLDYTIVKYVNDVYVDQLREIFTDVTGLDTSL